MMPFQADLLGLFNKKYSNKLNSSLVEKIVYKNVYMMGLEEVFGDVIYCKTA